MLKLKLKELVKRSFFFKIPNFLKSVEDVGSYAEKLIILKIIFSVNTLCSVVG